MNNFEKQHEDINSPIDCELTVESSALAHLAIDRAFGYTYDKPEQIDGSKYSDYFSDRRSENIDILACRPKLQKMYKYAALRHSYIKHVTLIDDEKLKDNAYFSASEQGLSGNNDKNVSSVHFNVLHNFDDKGRQEPGIPQLIKKVALQLGADWREIYQNRDAFDAFVLMHEFGHAADFISTYYIPMSDSDDNITEVLKKAIEKNSSDRKTQLQSLITSRPSIDEMCDKKLLPFNEDPNDKDPEKRKAIRSGIRQRIESYNSTQYREMPKEKKADFFAAEMIRQNYDLFFRAQGVDDDERGLIETGKPIDLDLGDWREVIGLHQGTTLHATRVMANENGRIVPKLYDGKPRIIEGSYDPMFVDERNLYINKYNDQNKPTSLLMTNINSVKAKRNKKTKKLEYLLTDESGSMYVMQIQEAYIK